MCRQGNLFPYFTNALVTRKLNLQIVQKRPDKPSEDEHLREEVKILRTLDHPNIVKCLDFFEEETCFYVVMELLEGGEVFDRLVKKVIFVF